MMMIKTYAPKALLLTAGVFLSGCGLGLQGIGGSGDGSQLRAIGDDAGFDSGSLTALEAGIFIDPDGCQIWMVDDGFEGYWSRRRDPASGLPVCFDTAPPGSIIGEISADAGIGDLIPVQP